MRETRRLGMSGACLAFVLTTVGATLPSPLYPLYQQRFGLSELTVTVVFATYAVGVFTTLIVCGQVSDRLGRRPVLAAALLCSLISAVTLLLASASWPLYIARAFSGVSIGLDAGAATAFVLELAPEGAAGRATLAAVAANVGGLGLGPVVSGAISQAFGHPLHTVFAVDIGLVLVGALTLAATRETRERARPLDWSMVRLRVPPEARRTFVQAATVGFAGFIVVGVYNAAVPGALGALLHVHNRLAVGAVVGSVFLTSAVGQGIVLRIGERRALPAGCAALMLGLGALAAGFSVRSPGCLIAAGVLGGLGLGMGMRGGLGMLGAVTPPAHRAETTSAYFVACYVGLTIPVVVIGAVAETAGLRGTAIGTSLIVLALVGAVLVSLVRDHGAR